MRYTTDYLTGSTLAHNGKPETAGRSFSSHRLLGAASKAMWRLRQGSIRTYVVIDRETGSIVDATNPDLMIRIRYYSNS